MSESKGKVPVCYERFVFVIFIEWEFDRKEIEKVDGFELGRWRRWPQPLWRNRLARCTYRHKEMRRLWVRASPGAKFFTFLNPFLVKLATNLLKSSSFTLCHHSKMLNKNLNLFSANLSFVVRLLSSAKSYLFGVDFILAHLSHGKVIIEFIANSFQMRF